MPLATDPQMQPLLRDAIARRIPIATPRRGPDGGVVGFVGPGGSGKTRCVARMATAYATRSDRPVAVVTLRPKDGGAELQRLLAPIGVPIHAEDDAAAASARIDLLREHALVLLDTPALSPRAEAERRVLAAELRRLQADELHVCVPATVAPGAGRAIIAAARELGADAIAVTHADETDELGIAVELAIDTELPISFLGRGTSLEAGLRAAAADDLALALVP
jgi:flagellar biosynthesis GTPase FlhF